MRLLKQKEGDTMLVYSNGIAPHIPSYQQKEIRISVIITTRNRAALLREAIESVLSSNHKGFTLDLIVVNDGSVDETAQVLEEYDLRAIHTSGLGIPQARNIGLQAAKGDFIAFLDDDDVWLPENMQSQLAYLLKHPEYGAAHAQVQLTSMDRVPFGRPQPEGPLSSGMIFEEGLSYWPQIGTLLVRANIAHELGDFDQSLTGDSDWDWFLRIAWHYPVARIEEALLLFRQRDSSYESLAWKRFPAMLQVFHRHTKPFSLLKRLQLRPILWHHRGWWASLFLQFAQSQAKEKEYQRMWSCIYYAFRCSPPHTLLGLVRWLQARKPSVLAQI
jgi:glycosyltransferase involved in cell wall biosynthesis